MPGSKNISAKKIYCEHLKGLQNEEWVAEMLIHKGYRIFGRRVRTPIVEVDILCQFKKTVFIVEVKSLGSLDFCRVRVSKRQMQKLRQCRKWLEAKWNCEVGLAFAYVLASGEVLIFNESGDAISL